MAKNIKEMDEQLDRDKAALREKMELVKKMMAEAKDLKK